MTEKMYFLEERNGYDREQVDSYISKLSNAYQTAYNEYQDVSGKYNSLLDDCKELDIQERTGLNSDIIAKTLMNTEILAQKIIADAHAEAVNVKRELRQMIADANAEVEKAQADAQDVIAAAHAEASEIVLQAKKNLERANMMIKQAVSEVRRLLATNLPDAENALAG